MGNQKLYKPTEDEVFKRIFGAIECNNITKSFLERTLQIKIDEVTLNHKLEFFRNNPKDKKMTADIIARDSEGRRYIIEMQRRSHPGIIKRFVGYLCKLHVSELKVKDDYDKLMKTTLLLIMEEPVPELKYKREYKNEYHFVIEPVVKNRSDVDLSYIMEIHIIELSKYKKYRKEGGEIDPWIEFLVNPQGKELEDMARSYEELQAAVQKLRELNADDEVREIAERLDWEEYVEADIKRCIREQATEQGLKRGMKRGMKQGIIQGRAEGLKQGRAQGLKEIAAKMLKKKISINEIMEYTGLSKKEIESIKETA